VHKEIAITGIGIGLPIHSQSQTELLSFLNTHLSLTPVEKRRLKAVYLSSGIQDRFSVIPDLKQLIKLFTLENETTKQQGLNTKERMSLYQEHALPLATKAINDCLQTSTAHITHLITVSCTGMYAPGLDIDIIHHLNLSLSTHRLCINFMGCYGVFNALKTAESICKANEQASVLIVSVEMCSLHLQGLQSIDHLISSAIFSDGAGALLVQCNAKKKRFVINDFYCDLMPQGKKDMTWDIGNHGFDIILSSYVPELIHSGIHSFVEKLFLNTDLHFNQCQHYAIHPGGKKILEACESALQLNKQDLLPSYQVLSQYGNMSSATIIFVLKKIWNTLTKEQSGEKIFSCAFGPGLTLESMLLSTQYV
jgi:predicted naringenin-chalcone synthase